MLFTKEKHQLFSMVLIIIKTALNIKKQQACVVRMIVTSKRDNSNKVLQYFQN
jgi:hypothetical protein